MVWNMKFIEECCTIRKGAKCIVPDTTYNWSEMMMTVNLLLHFKIPSCFSQLLCLFYSIEIEYIKILTYTYVEQ